MDLPVAGLGPADQRWVEGLTGHGLLFEQTCVELHAVLLRSATVEARSRGAALRIAGPEADDIACQAASDALLLIITRTAEFRGESRFTTWASRFAAFEVRRKLRQHEWRRCPPSDLVQELGRAANPAPGPEALAEARDLARATGLASARFSPAQRAIFASAVICGDAPAATAAALGMSTNAVHQALFRARRALRSELTVRGYLASAWQTRGLAPTTSMLAEKARSGRGPGGLLGKDAEGCEPGDTPTSEFPELGRGSRHSASSTRRSASA
jgi:RNA polymerase sigma factor (sigma-70 family)